MERDNSLPRVVVKVPGLPRNTDMTGNYSQSKRTNVNTSSVSNATSDALQAQSQARESSSLLQGVMGKNETPVRKALFAANMLAFPGLKEPELKKILKPILG